MTPLTDAQRALVEQYADWAVYAVKQRYYTMHPIWRTRFTLEELIAAAHWGLVQAAQCFDSSRGSFSTYARIRCEHAVTKELQGDLRQARGFRYPHTDEHTGRMVRVAERIPWPLDAETGQQIDLPAQAADERTSDALAYVRQVAMSVCRDRRDRVILSGWLAGKSYKAIGRELGASIAQIDNRRRAIIRQARVTVLTVKAQAA